LAAKATLDSKLRRDRVGRKKTLSGVSRNLVDSSALCPMAYSPATAAPMLVPAR